MLASLSSLDGSSAFVLSNDDPFNLGHYMNDVMGMWNMVALSNHTARESVLLNIDGVRSGGPAGGPAHRIMLVHDPDTHGPFSELYFHKWFAEVQRGVERPLKKVCYRSLYFFPQPGVPWFWNNWGRVDECSVRSASPLYQSFSVFLRQRLLDALGVSALPSPPTDHTHVVIEMRQIRPEKKRNAHATARVIANVRELAASLSAIPGVRVTVQDMAQLSFAEQVRLAHSASVLLSMHGAGTTHIFHMALGEKNCCGLVELFPDTSVELHTAQGYGNLARMLGLHHVRYVAERGATQAAGTTVDVQALRRLVEKMVGDIARAPTCLLDAHDTEERKHLQ